MICSYVTGRNRRFIILNSYIYLNILLLCIVFIIIYTCSSQFQVPARYDSEGPDPPGLQKSLKAIIMSFFKGASRHYTDKCLVTLTPSNYQNVAAHSFIKVRNGRAYLLLARDVPVYPRDPYPPTSFSIF